MRRTVILAALVATLLAGQGQAQDRYDRDRARDDQPPPGNYFRTCRNITVFDFGPNATISAQCRDETGRWRDTSTRFTGCERLDNRDGQLTCRGSEGGGYRPPPVSGGEGGGYRPAPVGGGGGGYRPPTLANNSQISLFGAPNFGGERFQTREEITNLPKRYNDQALSLKIEGHGAWQVCADSDFQGRCQVFDRDVPDLRFYGLGYAISSLRPAR